MISEIEKAATDYTNSKPLVIIGEAGAGKSALMARISLVREPSLSYLCFYVLIFCFFYNYFCFLLFSLQSLIIPKQTLANSYTHVYPHFVGASPESTSIRFLLWRLCSELKRTHFLSLDIPEDYEELVDTFDNIHFCIFVFLYFYPSRYTSYFLVLFSFLFCIVLYCFVLFCIVLYCIVLYCFVLFCFVLFCFVLFCFVLFCFVLFCFVLFCFVLFCFVLFCFVLFD